MFRQRLLKLGDQVTDKPICEWVGGLHCQESKLLQLAP